MIDKGPSRLRATLPQVYNLSDSQCVFFFCDFQFMFVTLKVNRKSNLKFFFFNAKILASCATTFLLLDIGVSLSYPTVINSALTGNNAKSNPNEQLLMDATSASWMGKSPLFM